MNVSVVCNLKDIINRTGGIDGRLKISVSTLLLFLLIAGCNNSGMNQSEYEQFVCGEKNNGRDHSESIQRSDIVLQRTNAVDTLSFVAERVTESELESRFFRDYNLYHAWGPLGHTQNITVTVGNDGCTAILPSEFNNLVIDAGLVLKQEKEADELLRFYLNFYNALPGRDDIRIVVNPSEIPGLADNQEYSEIIHPVETEPVEEGWRFEFTTWQWISGNLDKWSVEISTNAEVDIRQKERIATSLGDYVTIE